jgi:hypothetical protein
MVHMSAATPSAPSRGNDRPQRAGQRQPPEPPHSARRIALTRKQWLGLPLIMLVPILTLFGVFGEHHSEIQLRTRSISAFVRYPDRFRYRQIQRLDIALRNTSTRTIDTLRVSFDTAYISRFSSVRIVPSPSSAFVVDLLGVAPGETRLITGELWGEQYGLHRGRIVASSGSDSAMVEISTFVFP